MSTHKALVLESKQGQQVLKDEPTPKPNKGDLLIRIESAALNPVDHAIADTGFYVQKYPVILGADGAGVIEAVGEGVETYKQGDRVFFLGELGNSRHSTFQQKTIIPADLVAKIPDNWSFDQAATVPLAAITTAIGLYDILQLPLPNEGPAPQAGQWILVTGGSGSVGQLAIQLAKQSGLKVISTSSPHNFPLLKSLGADITIDRLAPDYISQIQSHTGNSLTLAYDASGKEAIQAAQLLSSSSPSRLVLVLPPPEGLEEAKKGKQVHSDMVFAIPYDERYRALAGKVWKLLEKLAAEGTLKPNPVKLLEGGLLGILDGQQQQREGKVSGFKFVARPQETKEE